MKVTKKPIYFNLTEELFSAIKSKIEKTPLSGTSLNLNLSDILEKTYEQIPEPRIYFTEHAYVKMLALVDACDKEVAWHGTVSVENGNYIITDILVYPQTVTGATVSTDGDKYAMWNLSLDNETVNSLRMQGHSHVMMGTSPSGVDDSYYKELLEQINDFYIFLITNKKGDFYIRFYDVANNIEFSNVPLTGVISENGEILQTWLTEALTHVVENKPVYTTPVRTSIYPSQRTFFDEEDDYWNPKYPGHRLGTSEPKKKPGRPKKQ